MAEAFAVPSEESLGLRDREGPSPSRQDGGAQEKQKPVRTGELRVWTPSSQYDELLSEHSVLKDEIVAAPNDVGRRTCNDSAPDVGFSARQIAFALQRTPATNGL